MPDMLTPQVLAAAGPLVLETFFKHFLGPKSYSENAKARKDDIMFDEAFVLMKTFLEIATKHPVAALQRFSLMKTPSPPWVALHRLLIPQTSLTVSAEFLIKAFGGEEMAYKVAGGTRWWQVRAGEGVEAEWIVMKKDYREGLGRDKEAMQREREKGKGKGKEKEEKGKAPARKIERAEEEDEGMVGEDGGTDVNGDFRPEMDQLRCMLYIHGGAYYWGSINTHRYTIWRYARKMRGRCFAVNYRKAPQYPFPCAIQDVLAAYLYLVNPPPGAKHHAIDPKNIILAGDSAGGGLVWALLQILRDTEGLELPAGAVLISPWSDLTHSFPSILQNTATDIVPPYGFIHKPSSLWPPPPPALTDEIQNRLRSRVKEAISRLAHDPSKADEARRRASISAKREASISPVRDAQQVPEEIRSSDPNDSSIADGKDTSDLHPITKKGNPKDHPGPSEGPSNPSLSDPAKLFATWAPRTEGGSEGLRPTTLAQCDTPLKMDVKGESVAIDTQIQLYATNAQLNHPWVSPVLGYLGGLPPLYILAGDNEVLRDEIIYAAHKAADPGKYPIRDDVKALLPSLQGIEERYGPTDVHLQVYDGACHDLPLFSMTKPARGAFRAISSFARWVTPSAPASLSISKSPNSPFISGRETPNSQPSTPVTEHKNPPTYPDAQISPSPGGSTFVTPAQSTTDLPHLLTIPSSARDVTFQESPSQSPITSSPQIVSRDSGSRIPRFSLSRKGSAISTSSLKSGDESEGKKRPVHPVHPGTEPSGDDAGPRFGEDPANQDSKAKPGSAGHTGIYRGPNPFTNHMIRERVAVDGLCRPLEPIDQLGAMQMPEEEVGMIKEGPAIRYLTGQALWDKKFSHALKTVKRHREKNLTNNRTKDTAKLVRLWQDKIRNHEARHRDAEDDNEVEGEGEWVDDGTEHERGQASENKEGGERKVKGKKPDLFMDQSWSWTWAFKGEAPPPSSIVSRRDFAEARNLALMADRMEDNHHHPVNGLSIWVGLATFFSNSTERNKAKEAVAAAREENKKTGHRDTGDGTDIDGVGKEKEKEKGRPTVTRKPSNGPLRRMSKFLGMSRKNSVAEHGDKQDLRSESLFV